MNEKSSINHAKKAKAKATIKIRAATGNMLELLRTLYGGIRTGSELRALLRRAVAIETELNSLLLDAIKDLGDNYTPGTKLENNGFIRLGYESIDTKGNVVTENCIKGWEIRFNGISLLIRLHEDSENYMEKWVRYWGVNCLRQAGKAYTARKLAHKLIADPDGETSNEYLDQLKGHELKNDDGSRNNSIATQIRSGGGGTSAQQSCVGIGASAQSMGGVFGTSSVGDSRHCDKKGARDRQGNDRPKKSQRMT